MEGFSTILISRLAGLQYKRGSPGMKGFSTILISRLAGLLYKHVVALWRDDYGANLRQKDPTKPHIKQSLREFISCWGILCLHDVT